MGGAKDCRYKKTEEKILAVFFKHPECTMWELAKKAGIARSTIYTHHCSVRQIIPNCEKRILEEYSMIIGKKMRNAKVGLLYLDMAVFIAKNRKIFEMFLKFSGREIIIKMILILEPKINEPEKVFKIYCSEVVEVIFEWGERGFEQGEIEKVLADIMYLTRTCHDRLMPLCRK